MADDVDKLKDQFKELGEQSPKMRDLANELERVFDVLMTGAGSSDKEIKNVTNRFIKLTDEINEFIEANTKAGRSNKELDDKIDAVNKTLKSNVDLFNKDKKSLAGLGDSVNDCIKSFASASKKIKETSERAEQLDEKLSGLKGAFDGNQYSVERFVKSLGGGGLSGKLAIAGVSAIYLTKQLADLSSRAREAVDKFNKYAITLDVVSKTSVVTPKGVGQMESLRKAVGTTRMEFKEFVPTLQQLGKIGFTIGDIRSEAKSIVNLFGKGSEAQAALREYGELLQSFPTLKQDLSVTATTDDKAAALYALAESGKVDVAIKAGLFGEVEKPAGEAADIATSLAKSAMVQEDIDKHIADIAAMAHSTFPFFAKIDKGMSIASSFLSTVAGVAVPMLTAIQMRGIAKGLPTPGGPILPEGTGAIPPGMFSKLSGSLSKIPFAKIGGGVAGAVGAFRVLQRVLSDDMAKSAIASSVAFQKMKAGIEDVDSSTMGLDSASYMKQTSDALATAINPPKLAGMTDMVGKNLGSLAWGIAETTGEFAVTGAMIGGPWGAAIGAGAGALFGLGAAVYEVWSSTNELNNAQKKLVQETLKRAKEDAGSLGFEATEKGFQQYAEALQRSASFIMTENKKRQEQALAFGAVIGSIGAIAKSMSYSLYNMQEQLGRTSVELAKTRGTMGPEFIENLGLIQKSASKRLNKVSKDLAKSFNILRNNTNKLSFEQLSEAVQKAESVIVEESLKFAKMMDTIIENVGQTPDLINIRLEQSLSDMPQVIAQSLGGALSAMSLDKITQVQTQLFSEQAKKTTKNIDDSFGLLAKSIADESKTFKEGRGVRLEAAKKISEKDLTGALEKGGKAPPEEAKKLAAAAEEALKKAEKGEPADKELIRKLEEMKDITGEQAKKAQEAVDIAGKFKTSPIADLLEKYKANATRVQKDQEDTARQITEAEVVIEKGGAGKEVEEAKTKLKELKEKQDKLGKAAADAGTSLATYRGEFLEDVRKQIEPMDDKAAKHVKDRVQELGGWSKVEAEQLQKIMAEEGAKGLKDSIDATFQPLTEKGELAKNYDNTLRTKISGLKAAKFEIPTTQVNKFLEKALGEINNLAAKYADIVIKTVERKSGDLLLVEKKLQGMESVLDQAGEFGASFEYLSMFADTIVEQSTTAMNDINARTKRMTTALGNLSKGFEGVDTSKLTAEGLQKMVGEQAKDLGLSPEDVKAINEAIQASFDKGIKPEQIARELKTSVGVKVQEGFNVVLTETAEKTTGMMKKLANISRTALAEVSSLQEDFASQYMDAVMSGTMAFDPKAAQEAVKAAKVERDEEIKQTNKAIESIKEKLKVEKGGYDESIASAEAYAKSLAEGSPERKQADENVKKLQLEIADIQTRSAAGIQKLAVRQQAAEIKYRSTALKFSQSELDVRQKFLDISKEVANTQLGVLEQIGAPFGLVMQKQAEIVGYAKDALDIERDKLSVIQDQLASMDEGPAKENKMLAIAEQRKKVVQAEAEVMSKAVQAQRSSIEKLLGAAVGEIGKIGGFRRASKAQIFGAGYVEGPGGIIARGGAQTKAQQAARVQAGMFKPTKTTGDITKDNTDAQKEGTDVAKVQTDAIKESTSAYKEGTAASFSIVDSVNRLAGYKQAMPPVLRAKGTPAEAPTKVPVTTEEKREVVISAKKEAEVDVKLKPVEETAVGPDAATKTLQAQHARKTKEATKLSLKDSTKRVQAEKKVMSSAETRVQLEEKTSQAAVKQPKKEAATRFADDAKKAANEAERITENFDKARENTDQSNVHLVRMRIAAEEAADAAGKAKEAEQDVVKLRKDAVKALEDGENDVAGLRFKSYQAARAGNKDEEEKLKEQAKQRKETAKNEAQGLREQAKNREEAAKVWRGEAIGAKKKAVGEAKILAGKKGKTVEKVVAEAPKSRLETELSDRKKADEDIRKQDQARAEAQIKDQKDQMNEEDRREEAWRRKQGVMAQRQIKEEEKANIETINRSLIQSKKGNLEKLKAEKIAMIKEETKRIAAGPALTSKEDVETEVRASSVFSQKMKTKNEEMIAAEGELATLKQTQVKETQTLDRDIAILKQREKDGWESFVGDAQEVAVKAETLKKLYGFADTSATEAPALAAATPAQTAAAPMIGKPLAATAVPMVAASTTVAPMANIPMATAAPMTAESTTSWGTRNLYEAPTMAAAAGVPAAQPKGFEDPAGDMIKLLTDVNKTLSGINGLMAAAGININDKTMVDFQTKMTAAVKAGTADLKSSGLS